MCGTASSPPFQTDVGVGQGSSLSPILSAIYFAPVIRIWEKRINSLSIPIPASALSFVDDGLLISQEKNSEKTNATLYAGFNILSPILRDFGLVVEHAKSEVFHFTRATKQSDPPPLDLSPLGGPILRPKDTWRYLGFFFDKKLTFRYHTHYYNRAMSTVKSMRMLGNSNRGLSPSQKRLLYRTCILPIATYSFQLWYFKGAPVHYSLKDLRKMQRRAALWITGAFRTSPTWGIEAIAGLIPIHLHLNKLGGRHNLRTASLPRQHAIRTLLDPQHSKSASPHRMATSQLTPKQNIRLKSPIVDINYRLNETLPAFDNLNGELRPGQRLVDLFPDRFSFITVKRSDPIARVAHLRKLDEVYCMSQNEENTALVIADAGGKNNIATSVAHVHRGHSITKRTLHQAMNVLPTEAELFSIRCGINQAISTPGVNRVIIITDAIHAAEKIFDTSCHPLQLHTIAISRELKCFFQENPANHIEFWDCPSKDKWPPHHAPSTPAKCLGILAERTSAIHILGHGKCISRLLTIRGSNF